MERFTIFRLHYESLKRCTPEIRLELYDTMLGYAFDGKEPEFKNGMAEALWIAILPVIQYSIKQAQNGSKPKPRTNTLSNQTESKPNPSQIRNESKSDPIKEEEVEVENEKENTTLKVDYGKIKDLWDSICGGSLGKIHKMTESRKSKIKIRANEFEKSGSDYLAAFENIFTLIMQTDFLLGNNNRSWKVNFDWIIENDQNYVKVLEGRYSSSHSSHQIVKQYESRRLSEHAAEESFFSQQSAIATSMLLRDENRGLAGEAQDD